MVTQAGAHPTRGVVWSPDAGGWVLVLALIVVGFLLALSGNLGALFLTQQRASTRSTSLSRAFHLAEAGVDATIHMLRANPTSLGLPYTELRPGAGGYASQVVLETPGRWLVRATGSFPSNDPWAVNYATRAIEAVVQLTQGAGLGDGIMGEQAIRISSVGDKGVTVDSYDSRFGPYDVSTAQDNVRLRINGSQPRAMTLIGRATIRGDVVLGPESDPAQTLWHPLDQVSISGPVTVADAMMPLEPVTLPSLPDGGSLRLSGHDVVSLPGGIYRFHELKISGQGQLVFTGPAQVYVDGDVQIAGQGIVTSEDRPPNLTLYVTGSDVSVSGDVAFHAKLVAPEATVALSGRTTLYGAVQAREVCMTGNAAIHYDEALSMYDAALNPRKASDPSAMTILGWRELDPSP